MDKVKRDYLVSQLDIARAKIIEAKADLADAKRAGLGALVIDEEKRIMELEKVVSQMEAVYRPTHINK